MLSRSLRLVLVLALVSCPAAAASTVFVDVSKLGGGNGQSWATAYNDLQQGLAKAATTPSVTEIWVAKGVYRPGPAGSRNLAFPIAASIQLLGGFDGTETSADARDPVANPTILSGDLQGDDGPEFTNRSDNAYHVIVPTTTCTIDGFVIAAGDANDPGVIADADCEGAGLVLASNGAQVLVRNCTFRDHRAGIGFARGGAIRVFAGKLTLVDCVIERCEAQFGGAIALDDHVVLERTTVRDNHAYNGGGVLVQNGLIEAYDSLFHDNFAQLGGALEFDRGTGILERCTFDANGKSVSGSGGAAVLIGMGEPTLGPNVTFEACTFTRNEAALGSAIKVFGHVGGAVLTVRRSTFVDNVAFPKGGAIHVEDGVLTFGAFTTIEDSLLADNAGGQIVALDDSPSGTVQTFVRRCTLANAGAPSGGIRVQNSFTVVEDSILWFPNGPAIADLGGTVVQVTRSCVSGGHPGTGNFAADPQFAGFAPGALGDFRVLATSPCIDAADPLVSTAQQDLAHGPRAIDGDGDGVLRADVGAYEWAPLALGADATIEPGVPFALSVSGVAGTSTFLFVGSAPGVHVLPGFGGLFFDLAQPWLVLPLGAVPIAFAAPIPAAVPAGIALELQAAGVVGPLRATSNVVHVTTAP